MVTGCSAEVSPPTLAAAFAGMGMALFGVYWDDAWHTDRGRDDLLSPPHLSLYAGVALLLVVVVWWARLHQANGPQRDPVSLGVVGAVFTLGSAALDEWWHQAFGRDAVLWSPPHLAAVTGTIAVASAVALIATEAGANVARRSAIAGAGVVGAWQVLVLEYDTDVAQFSSLWYLPVMAVGLASAALAVQAAASSGDRWPATRAGAVYTILMLAVTVGLWSTGFSTPIVPLVVPALVVTDVGRRRRWGTLVRAAVFVLVLFATSWPYLGVAPGGVQPSSSEAAAGAAIATIAVAAVLAATDPAARLRQVSVVSAAVLVGIGATLTLDGPHAAAHDPGQGEEFAPVVLRAEVSDREISIEVLPDGVGDTEPARVLARRGDRLIAGPLLVAPTGWIGQVDVDQDGRWFVYVEARRGGQELEAWIPVIVGSEETISKATALYIADPRRGLGRAQVSVGVGLALLIALLLARIMLTVRRRLSAAPAV